MKRLFGRLAAAGGTKLLAATLLTAVVLMVAAPLAASAGRDGQTEATQVSESTPTPTGQAADVSPDALPLSSNSPVPEPATVAFLAVGSVLTLIGRKRRV